MKYRDSDLDYEEKLPLEDLILEARKISELQAKERANGNYTGGAAGDGNAQRERVLRRPMEREV